MKTHAIRLTKGADLYNSIMKFCQEKNIEAGVVVSSVGSVTTARVRDASGVDIQTVNENLEIISVNGTVSKNRLHLHIAFSRKDLSCLGGHLTEGTIINTTCELVILELPNTVFEKGFDSNTGYGELSISYK